MMTEPREAFDTGHAPGHSAAWDQKWDQAMGAYWRLLKLVPNEPNALTSLGFALLQMDRLDDALRCYQRAACLNPGDPVAPEKCGEIFERQGRLNDAGPDLPGRGRSSPQAPRCAEGHCKLGPRGAADARITWPRTRAWPWPTSAPARPRPRCSSTLKSPASSSARATPIRPCRRSPAPSSSTRSRPTRATRSTSCAAAWPCPCSNGSGRRRPSGRGIAVAAVVEPATPVLGEWRQWHLAGRRRRLTQAMEPGRGHSWPSCSLKKTPSCPRRSGTVGALTRGTGASWRRPGPPGAGRPALLGQAVSQLHQRRPTPAAIKQYESALHAGLDKPGGQPSCWARCTCSRTARPRPSSASSRPLQPPGGGAWARCLAWGRRNTSRASSARRLTSLLAALTPARPAGHRAEPARQPGRGLREPGRRPAQATPESLSPITGRRIIAVPLRRGLARRAGAGPPPARRRALDGQVTPLADLLAVPGASQVVDSLRRIESLHGPSTCGTAPWKRPTTPLGQSPTHLPVHIRMAEILAAEDKTQAAIDKYARRWPRPTASAASSVAPRASSSRCCA